MAEDPLYYNVLFRKIRTSAHPKLQVASIAHHDDPIDGLV